MRRDKKYYLLCVILLQISYLLPLLVKKIREILDKNQSIINILRYNKKNYCKKGCELLVAS